MNAPRPRAEQSPFRLRREIVEAPGSGGEARQDGVEVEADRGFHAILPQSPNRQPGAIAAAGTSLMQPNLESLSFFAPHQNAQKTAQAKISLQRQNDERLIIRRQNGHQHTVWRSLPRRSDWPCAFYSPLPVPFSRGALDVRPLLRNGRLASLGK